MLEGPVWEYVSSSMEDTLPLLPIEAAVEPSSGVWLVEGTESELALRR